MVAKLLRKVVHDLTLRSRGEESVAHVIAPLHHEMLDGAEEDIEDVREGKPRSKTQWISRSSDGGVATGIWECSAGTFGWYFAVDEIVHVLDGEATVTHDGKKVELKAGSVAYFPIGAQTEWCVPRRLRKLFVHREPAAIVHKFLRGR